MDTARWDLAGNIFERLLGTPQAQRTTLLDSLCGDDAELKQIVESMLDSENSAQRFDEGVKKGRLMQSGDTTSEVVVEPHELQIGPWHLVRKIGSGGMGV